MLSLAALPFCLASRPSSAHSVRDGHLFVEEIDPVALAQCLEAPFLLVSRSQIADNLTFIGDAFRARHASASLIYSAQLPLAARLCSLLRDAQVHLEAASPAEIALLCGQGVAASRLVVRAGRGPETVAAALAAGAGSISLRTMDEAIEVAAAAAHCGVRARCMLRFDDELAGGWWARRPTGPLAGPSELMRARLSQALESPWLEVVGLGADLGPQVHETEAYSQLAQLLCGLADELTATAQAAIQSIELGGGMAGEEIVVVDPQGAPLGAAEGVAREVAYDDYARVVATALGGRAFELRINVGVGLLAGAATLLARLAPHDGRRPAAVADRRLALVGDGWLLPDGANSLWHAPTAVANRASELHSALHWVALPRSGRSTSGDAPLHVLRRALPPTTTSDDLLAFLDWGASWDHATVVGDHGETEPAALLVDGNRLSLLEARAGS